MVITICQRVVACKTSTGSYTRISPGRHNGTSSALVQRRPGLINPVGSFIRGYRITCLAYCSWRATPVYMVDIVGRSEWRSR